jgi:hypothetical protein
MPMHQNIHGKLPLRNILVASLNARGRLDSLHANANPTTSTIGTNAKEIAPSRISRIVNRPVTNTETIQAMTKRRNASWRMIRASISKLIVREFPLREKGAGNFQISTIVDFKFGNLEISSWTNRVPRA